PSPACVRILHQMGLTDVLPAQVEGADPQASWTELACETNDPAFRRNVVQAHEELAALPGPAGEQFKAVVRCMGQPQPPAPPPPPLNGLPSKPCPRAPGPRRPCAWPPPSPSAPTAPRRPTATAGST